MHQFIPLAQEANFDRKVRILIELDDILGNPALANFSDIKKQNLATETEKQKFSRLTKTKRRRSATETRNPKRKSDSEVGKRKPYRSVSWKITLDMKVFCKTYILIKLKNYA